VQGTEQSFRANLPKAACKEENVFPGFVLTSRVVAWMFEVRYAGGDRAAGSRGMLVQARTGHLRIDIRDFQSQLLGGRICRFSLVR
jgi:hypothetical protein